MFSDVDREIAHVRTLVAARFPVYDTRVTPQAVAFHVTVDPFTMEQRFDELRLDLVPQNYIPFLTQQGGEHVILVQRRPPQRFFGTHVNLALLVITLLTTTWAGAIIWAGYVGADLFTLDTFANGSLFFTIPLMGILGIHEMGHYVVARRYKVHASLPFFIPAPFTLLGTFGAMISMRDPIPNRKALIDIGASGPVLGLLAAIPITAFGLYLTGVDLRPVPPNPGGAFFIDVPLLYTILAAFVPIPEDVMLHPTAFAGWVGLFVTALNLLPAGQLDGGHVARAVLGDNGKYVSYAAIGFMVVLSFWYFGWLIIALFILFLGARHPPPLNDLSKLDVKRQGLAAAAVAVLVLSWVSIPIGVIEPQAGVEFRAVDAPDVPTVGVNVSASRGATATVSFLIVNVGNLETNVTLTLDLPGPPITEENVTFANATVGPAPVPVSAHNVTFVLNAGEVANVTLSINASDTAGVWRFSVKADADTDFRAVSEELQVTVRVS